MQHLSSLRHPQHAVAPARRARPLALCAATTVWAPLRLSGTCSAPTRCCAHISSSGSVVCAGSRGSLLRRQSSAVVCAAAAAKTAATPEDRGTGGLEAWHSVVAILAGAMLLCNLHRSIFSALLPELTATLQLRPGQIGEIQASMLAAYLIGQVPAGLLADRFGGVPVLMCGLFTWSLATAATSLAVAPPGALLPPLAAIYASRVLLGLSSACAMPCVAAAAVAWVPVAARAGAVSLIYALFNIGGVVGLALAPPLAQSAGVTSAFVIAGALGAAWAVSATAFLAFSQMTPSDTNQQQQQEQQHHQQQQEQQQGAAVEEACQPLLQGQDRNKPQTEGSAVVGSAKSSSNGVQLLGMQLSQAGVRQVAVLCAAHGFIGYGFFLMQNWIPVYLSSLGQQALSTTGAMSALPWLAAAGVGLLSGSAADRLIRAGVTPLTTRRAFQCVSFLGCAASALPLALLTTPSLGIAVACLTANLAFYSASFGGFHAYLQDVAGTSGGVLQGLTNSCSILMGMFGSLSTGWLVEATGSYKTVFWLLAALYTAGAVMWATCTSSDPIQPTSSGS